MITKNHPTAYAKLFDEATEILKKKKGGDIYNENFRINSIDDYFACLKDLALLERENEDIDPIFTILPTTEETFQIDANTRDIIIPANFSKYGVGVQGDEVAEIIYFSIDRYFDAVDLATKEILIQWQHEKNKDEDYLSAIYKKSLTLQPGKIVFGWPITNEMTSQFGNILFSVRFYDKAKDENDETILVYSFGTLTKSIKIQPALDFDLSEESYKINKNDKIFNNLSNSQKVDLEFEIATPEIVGYYIVANNKLEDSSDKHKYDLDIKFAIKAEIPQDIDTSTIKVSGSPLSYKWEYSETKDSIRLDCDPSIQSIEYFKVDTSNENYNPNEIYYVKDEENNYSAYYLPGSDSPFVDGKELYTRYSICSPKKPGFYWATAIHNYASGLFRVDTTETPWEVPYPKKPSFSLEYPSNGKTLIMLGEEDNTEAIRGKVSSEDKGTLSAEWYYCEEDNEENAVRIENTLSEGVDGELECSYIPKNEGYYYLHFINYKNNDNSGDISEAIPAFCHASSILEIDHYVDETPYDAPSNTSEAIKSNPEETLKVIPASLLKYSEQVSYQWYKEASSSDQEDLKIDGAINNTFTPSESGWYYCKITNQYKTTSTSKDSAFFSVAFR